MNKMNNKTRALIITASMLFLTLGIATVKIAFFPPEGFYYGGPDLLLMLPALPFIWIVGLFENNLTLATTIIFASATIFWLLVGYGIGYLMDKKQKKSKK